MKNKEFLKKFGLLRNPFPPAAAGIDTERELYLSKTWRDKIDNYFNLINSGEGPKAFPVIGQYGSGKTVLLKTYLKEFFESKRITAFYFENPGVEFYDLANTLMRNMGRYEFSKALWERCKEYIPKGPQATLFPVSYSEWLATLKTKAERERKANEIQSIIREKLKITEDEEVAYKLALIIVETASKPYFEYRDFIAGTKVSLVAEKEEARYFKAIVRAITETYGVEGVAFLIDEFEEVAIPKRMPTRKSHEYLATLRRLIDFSETENLWIVLSMTPEGADTTTKLNPGLWQRFTRSDQYRLDLDPLSPQESKELLIWWLDRARVSDRYKQKTFPFPEEIEKVLKRGELRLPRSLVRIGFFALSKAEEKEIEPPFSLKYIEEIINDLYPQEKKDTRGARDEQEKK